MKKAIYLLAAVVVGMLLTSCVSMPEGGTRFDPWEAVIRADNSVEHWLVKNGYPTHGSLHD